MAPLPPRLDSSPSGPGTEQHVALSPSLRCSAASLVSWESEMKHCSSGREKLFSGRRPDSGEWPRCLRAPGKMGAHPGSLRRLLVRKTFLDSSPTRVTICFVIPGKSGLLCVPQFARL